MLIKILALPSSKLNFANIKIPLNVKDFIATKTSLEKIKST
jgi:hypothetical protein